MRIIKENTYKYDPFYYSLPIIKKALIGNNNLKTFAGKEVEQVDEMKELYFTLITHLIEEINFNPSLNQLFITFSNVLNKIKPVKEYGIFILNKNKDSFSSLNENVSEHTCELINTSLKEGILDYVFETGATSMIPDFKNSYSKRPEYNYFIFPLKEKNENKGVFSLLIKTSEYKINPGEEEVIKIFLNIVLPKIELLKAKEELVDAYSELQVYQSKLNNDYKLSAIGELSSGMSEEILSSLQIILSGTELINAKPSDKEAINTIKDQVQKITNYMLRLVKFSDVNNSKVQIFPCNLNDILSDFHKVIYPSFKKENYECMIDLGKNIPPVLSHPNLLNQIFTNVFSLIKPISTSGGIILQTRSEREVVVLKVFTTDKVNINFKDTENPNNMSYTILDKLIQKHEGEIKINSSDATGTTIFLTFPLRRKIR